VPSSPHPPVKRRDFVILLGGAGLWPLIARAQQAPRPALGFLDSGSQVANAHLVAAFHQGLNETGFVEGQNVVIEYRWADGDYDRLPALAAELVRIPVAVLATGGGEPAVRAARAATTTIPIVFDSTSNPVELGMVASLNRPGGNMTGVNQMVEELVTKELGLLHELVPQAPVIAMLANPKFPRTEAIVSKAQTAIRALGCTLQIFTADSEQDLDTAFTTIARQGIGALFVAPAPFFYNRRDRIIALASRHSIPVLYVRREFAAAGGLMSYGTSLPDTYRQVGIYAGRILKGEKPSDLPVVQPTNSSWRSTSRPRRRSACRCRTGCSRSPTRSLNKVCPPCA
jgi:putative tryptophan/tyrosine transport system substrate-binding protein